MTGKKLFDTLLIGLCFLSGTALLGVTVFRNVIYQKPIPSDAIEFASLKEDSMKYSKIEAYKLPPITVNLKSNTSKLRFLDFEVFLVPYEADDVDRLDDYKPQIADTIIDATIYMDPDELNTPLGKMTLNHRIQKRVNKLMRKEVVRDVIYNKFIVQ